MVGKQRLLVGRMPNEVVCEWGSACALAASASYPGPAMYPVQHHPSSNRNMICLEPTDTDPRSTYGIPALIVPHVARSFQGRVENSMFEKLLQPVQPPLRLLIIVTAGTSREFWQALECSRRALCLVSISAVGCCPRQPEKLQLVILLRKLGNQLSISANLCKRDPAGMQLQNTSGVIPYGSDCSVDSHSSPSFSAPCSTALAVGMGMFINQSPMFQRPYLQHWYVTRTVRNTAAGKAPALLLIQALQV